MIAGTFTTDDFQVGETYAINVTLSGGMRVASAGRVQRIVETPRGPAIELIEAHYGRGVRSSAIRTFRIADITHREDKWNGRRPRVQPNGDTKVRTLIDQINTAPAKPKRRSRPAPRKRVAPPVDDAGMFTIRIPSVAWRSIADSEVWGVTVGGSTPVEMVDRVGDVLEAATFTRRGRWPESGTWTIRCDADVATTVADWFDDHARVLEETNDRRTARYCRDTAESIRTTIGGA